MCSVTQQPDKVRLQHQVLRFLDQNLGLRGKTLVKLTDQNVCLLFISVKSLLTTKIRPVILTAAFFSVEAIMTDTMTV